MTASCTSANTIDKFNTSHLLEVRNLQTYFPTRAGLVRAVDGVSFHIDHGEVFGLVGESGCGKSVTSLSIMRLVARPGEIVAGRVLFNGRDLLKITEEEMRSARGNEIAMIFQDPMTSLNPVHTVGEQIAEAIRLHRHLNRKEAKLAAIATMHEVAIPDPARRFNDYPHQLSGGMRQRIMIAMALACDPRLLIADEPTTALDVTIQAQILDLLDNLRRARNLGILLITHDMGVIAEIADRVAVMYAGLIVEEAPVKEIFSAPKHPYTVGLLNSVPKLSSVAHIARSERLPMIEGSVPNPAHLPLGCHFAPRCSRVMPRCRTEKIPEFTLPNHTKVRCELYRDQSLAQ